MIAREVQLLKESGKPVVACMGDVAASGGYYIAGWL
jgi:protease-4